MRTILVLLLLPAVACAPDADPPPAAPTDGSGPVIVGPGSRPGGTGGVGGEAGAGGAGGEGGHAGATGACVSDSDLDILDMSVGGREVAAGCAVSSILPCNPNDPVAYAGCIAGCVARRLTGLSTGCALCYGAVQGCALENSCTAACNLNTCSAACLECVKGADCIAELNACTGLEDDDECTPVDPGP